MLAAYGDWKYTRQSPAQMTSGYGGRRKRRISRYLLTCSVVAILLLYTYWQQQSLVAGVMIWGNLGYADNDGGRLSQSSMAKFTEALSRPGSEHTTQEDSHQ